MKGSQRWCSAHPVSWERLQSQLPRKAAWAGDSAAPGWTRVWSYRVASWGPAPVCAHLSAAAGDPLRPWDQAPHRVRVRRCRLPLWAGLMTATQVPLGRSGRPSAHPRPPVLGLPGRAALTPAAGLGVHVPTHSGDGRAQVAGQAGCRGQAQPPVELGLPRPLPHGFRRQDVPGRTEDPGAATLQLLPSGQRPAAPAALA